MKLNYLIEVIFFYSGIVGNLSDVDLAIVSHSEKACLLLELKWFIAPTTAKERIHKSKEIKGGISQILKLKQAFMDNHKPLLEKLGIDSSYRLEGVVVSENWIGYGNVQSPDVPVIRASHLIAKLKATDTLLSTMDWLKDREYLPKEGEHFKVHRPVTTIGNWNLKWFGIEPLIKDAFFSFVIWLHTPLTSVKIVSKRRVKRTMKTPQPTNTTNEKPKQLPAFPSDNEENIFN